MTKPPVLHPRVLRPTLFQLLFLGLEMLREGQLMAWNRTQGFLLLFQASGTWPTHEMLGGRKIVPKGGESVPQDWRSSGKDPGCFTKPSQTWVSTVKRTHYHGSLTGRIHSWPLLLLCSFRTRNSPLCPLTAMETLSMDAT